VYKQHINIKTLQHLLTDCKITIETGSSYSKITHRSSIGLGPTDTILSRNLKTIEIYLSWRAAQGIWMPNAT